jgi:hypothetical protein
MNTNANKSIATRHAAFTFAIALVLRGKRKRKKVPAQ